MPKPVIDSEMYPDIRDAMLLVSGFDDIVTMHLLIGPVTATPTTDWAAITQASFPGYAAKDSGTPFIAFEVTRQQWELKFPEPIGGWTWVRTAGAGDPQTIGGVWCSGVGGMAIASAIITNVGDAVTISEIYLPLKDLVVAL